MTRWSREIAGAKVRARCGPGLPFGAPALLVFRGDRRRRRAAQSPQILSLQVAEDRQVRRRLPTGPGGQASGRRIGPRWRWSEIAPSKPERPQLLDTRSVPGRGGLFAARTPPAMDPQAARGMGTHSSPGRPRELRTRRGGIRREAGPGPGPPRRGDRPPSPTVLPRHHSPETPTMLLELVIWTSALAVVPFLLAVLEYWLLGGFAPDPGSALVHRGQRLRALPPDEPWPLEQGPLTVADARDGSLKGGTLVNDS
jgi:hypothetical protein